MRKSRPVISVEPSKSDRFISAVTWILLIVLWILPIVFYQDLPEQIPSHFNASGNVDDLGGKNTLFLLGAIATLMAIILTILNRHPHKFNYLVNITTDNAAFQYRNAMRMVRLVRLSIVLVFLMIVIFILLMSTGSIRDPGPGPLVLLVLLVQLPVFYLLYKSVKRG
jgi:uncharacterized membrane protein